MEDNFKKTIEILTDINELIKKKKQIEVVSKSELDDKIDNLDEYSDLLENMTQNIEELSNSHLYSTDEIRSLLLKLHLNFADYIWHIDEIHDLLKDFIGNFPDSN
ncbi:hypothetical protein ACH95_05385 [Bacillus glycinifermentans]|uniref:hypothetical protein n=1 Tax=Bacillus glycinifermentans TaxID=1664069 RepID=UPI000653B340|nr:hypothetical protein [Bacillus glycinifermentans]KMM62615.1 hypothetical protein ACH95_05385 [Bacillus glycinifermentans]MEC0494854.1 hypothetical protein [Bacillus glycinifermentans]MEC0541002.1 hypothetical protein [Bacillus glycinifermentans]